METQDDESTSVRRDENCLVVPDNGHLPHRCIRCSAPASGKPKRYGYTWNPHGLQMGRGVTHQGSIGKNIAAVATNRRGWAYVYFCDRHRPKVKRVVVTCTVAILIGAAFFVYGGIYAGRAHFANYFTAGFIFGAGGLITMAMYFALPPTWLQCALIKDGFLWLVPKNESILEGLDEWTPEQWENDESPEVT